MKCILDYSRKIVSKRQRRLVVWMLGVCVAAFVYSVLATEYLCGALESSVADRGPHIRLFLSEKCDPVKVLSSLATHNNVLRSSVGVLLEKDVTVTTREQATRIDDEGNIVPGDVVASKQRRIQFVGYDFGHSVSCPPVCFDNVYSRQTRKYFVGEQRKEPINVLNNMSPNERKNDWCVNSRGLSDLLPHGDYIQFCPFEIGFSNGTNSETIVFRSVGTIANSAFTVSGNAGPELVYAKTESIKKIAQGEDIRPIIDVSLKDRGKSRSMAEALSRKFLFAGIEVWQDRDPVAMPILKGFKHIALLGVGAIVALSVIGIGIIVSILVLTKSKQLAIVYAMGCDARQVRSVFLFAGLRAAMSGVIVGVLIGFAAAYASIETWKNIVELFCSNPSPVLIVPTETFVSFLAILILSCALACWIPTQRLVMEDPIKNLRKE